MKNIKKLNNNNLDVIMNQTRYHIKFILWEINKSNQLNK